MEAALKVVTSGESIQKSAARFEIPFKWLKHFATHVNVSVENPVLLVMDNHSSHSSFPSYLFCREKGIHIVSIPPHTSHRLQPLDLTFYGPLKTAFNKERDLFMNTRGCQKITPYDLAGLFNKAYGRVSTLERSGIWPLNLEAFGEEDFLSAINLRPTIIANEEPAIQITVASEHEDAATPSSAHPSASNSTSTKHPTTNIGTLNFTIAPSSGLLQHITSRKRTTVFVADVSPILGSLNATNKNPLTKKRKTTKQRSEILTASSIKERLEEAERRRSLKLTKTSKTSRKPSKRKQAKKALFDSSSSDCENNNVCDDESKHDFFLCSGETNTTKKVCNAMNSVGTMNHGLDVSSVQDGHMQIVV
ncbi:hypothetical protein ILUMI_02106 [Ignelater luminosus]|uniref:DDE-1 domain-containing protein n=1 Tax=Ignelater luminosus TaxID=2038154 RepID=A0A8K0DIV8_IGNLU|nr:hypothetical protein ILUMI_02106 [Ignelater luminosus]